MISKINDANTNAETNGFNESRIISKPPKALVDVKKESYCTQILTIGPLYQIISGCSSLYDCKALCVKRFRKRHEISDAKQLMQRLFDDPSNLDIHYSDLPKYASQSLQLMVTVDTIFIYELLLFLGSDRKAELKEEYNYFSHTVLQNDIIHTQVVRDLFLMGNQIPMFYLKKLMKEFPETPNNFNKDSPRFRGLCYLLKMIDPFIAESFSAESFEIKFLDCNHLLDCLYVWVLREPLQKTKRQSTNPCTFPRLPNPFCTKQAASKKTKLRVTACQQHHSSIKPASSSGQLKMSYQLCTMTR